MDSEHRNNRKYTLEESERVMLNLLSELSIPEGLDREAAWYRLKRNLSVGNNNVKPLWNPWSLSGIAAAVALLIASYFLFWSTDLTSISTERGQKISFYLPDSSKVVLNAESTITYNEKDWENNRSLNLDGEAFFEVKRGEKFKVNADNGIVEVLGTSFNIFSRAKDFTVTCVTGKVKVSNKQQNDFTILNPGFATSIKDNQVQSVVRIQDSEFNNWSAGEFYFEQTRLSLVLEEIERQYDVKIDLDDAIGERLYTGFFKTDNLTESLDLVLTPMGLTYTMDEKNSIKVIQTNKP